MLPQVKRNCKKSLSLHLIKDQQREKKYLYHKYVKQLFDSNLVKFNIRPKKKFTHSNIIWQFWESSTEQYTPEVVKKCLESVQKYKGSYQVVVLNLKTVRDYLDLPDFIYEKMKTEGSFRICFFTDLLRICLLDLYGGIWLDATILLTDDIDKALPYREFFMFQRSSDVEEKAKWTKLNHSYFSWEDKFCVKSLNSIIVSRKNYPLLNKLKIILLNYWYREHRVRYYFFFQVLFDILVNSQQMKHLNCEIISDTYPHEMALNYNLPYSKTRWNEINSLSKIHKLTYFNDVIPGTILAHVLARKGSDFFYNVGLKPNNLNITFCTMLFNMKSKKLEKIKDSKRDFCNFYLQSLEKLTQRYKQIFLWCDQETAEFIKKHNLKEVNYKVVNLEQLPYAHKREQYLKILHKMKKKSCNEGYLLHDLEPEDVVDYLIIVLSKIHVIKDAKEQNFFNSDFFYWIDAGSFNKVYARFWKNWDGFITEKTNKAKFAFMCQGYKIKMSSIALSSYTDIALIKAPFEISASHFMLNKRIVNEFYISFTESINFLENKDLISTEQSVFSVMLKRKYNSLFEFAKTENYNDVMNLVSKNSSKVNISRDPFVTVIKQFIKMLVFILPGSTKNTVTRQILYENSNRAIICKLYTRLFKHAK